MKADELHFIYKEINFFRTIRQQEIAWISISGEMTEKFEKGEL
jgi:hypothetical protein